MDAARALVRLDEAIRAAGIPIHGVSPTSVNFRPEATEAHRQQAQAMLDAFDPTPTPEERLDRAGGRVLAALALLRTQELHLAAPNAGVWGSLAPPTSDELQRARAVVVAAGRSALGALRA